MTDARPDQLLRDLLELQARLRAATLNEYQRMNPLSEDLVDWQERGRAWTRDDRGVTIYGSTTVVGDVEIGRQTWIGPFCQIDGTGGLRIGEFCSISAGTQLLSHDTVAWALSGGLAPPRRQQTVVGNRCFLGTLSVVVAGVSIGDGCVVAAGAVVTRDVPPGSIVAGVPARVIGRVEVSGDAVRLEYFAAGDESVAD